MFRKWKWFVYILECVDGSYYTGMTWKPELRLDQHLSGLGGKYTAKHPVKKLAYLEEYEELESARLREKQIQGWIREKKQKLISGEWTKF
jgi:putative endonuclease